MREFKPEHQQGKKEATDFVPEGEFSGELTDSQKAAIRHSINLGRELQKEMPTIIDDFRSGLTFNQITEKYNLQLKLGGSLSTPRNAVWYALKGYHGEMRFVDIPTFDGLIEPEEYNLIARRHSTEASVATGRKNVDSGLRQFAEKKGIHAQTLRERKAVGKLGVIAQGSKPYEKSELDLINELALLPEYQRGSRINAVKIAAELNRQLHNGEMIRTPT